MALSPSKLCRWLLLAVFMKLAILTFVFTDLVPNLLKDQGALLNSQSVALTDNNENETLKNSDTKKLIQVNQAVAQTATPASKQTAPKQPAVDSLTKEAMQQRYDDLSRKEQELRAIEKGIDTKLEDLKKLESKLQSMLKEADELKDVRYKHLIDVYSNMKAKQAAEVLQTLDEKIAVKILAGMKGRQAGEILTYVIPAKAARLSESLTKMQMSFE
ncbi:hypothetical protein SAMN02745728_02073 [Desulfovibrio litoralis DSM 11393]|uniref:Flagellar motility protein MotE, a chaperone for MotC folding n=2 Tax=Desulfovibrio litoralis TaxID=466107 RepID=A0A1M7TIW7_9BACT|nr:hypothetical protein SAMN02745728_02073 [Desulfovibrio litoralis DSM 11393]